MKRALVVMMTLMAMVAFVSGGMAQAPAKTEKPAAPERPAPAPTSEKAQPAAEKPKDEKTGAVRFGGTVTGYEAGKMIKVKGSDDKEVTFGVTKKTKVKGEVKQGVMVTVAYKKDGDKMVATAINVSKGKKTPKKAREKTAEKAPEKK